jgi:hypothetical protein
MPAMIRAFPAIIRLLPFLLLNPSTLLAQGRPVPVDRETLTVIGWNKDCSVALAHLGYPAVGAAIADEPVRARLGTLTIPPGKEAAEADARVDWDGARTWQAAAFAEAKAELAGEGYTQKGWKETIRPDPVVNERDLPRLIVSTDTLRTKSTDFPDGYPRRWRLSEIHYSPLSAVCGLLVFTDTAAKPNKPFYTYRLVRIGNPGVRSDRALAHVTNGLLLLQNGDRQGALAETGIAALMAPDYAPARYQRAGMLALGGQPEAAVDELAAAVKLEPNYRAKARDDENFDDIRWMPKFQDLTK